MKNNLTIVFAVAILSLTGTLPSEVPSKGYIKIITANKRESGKASKAITGKILERREIDFFQSHRNRRFSGLIPVRDRISNAICSYEVITDINFHRIPNKIDRVICKAEDCKVIGNSDFKCAQLYAQLNVTYPKENCRMEFEIMNIEYACICARSIGSTHITVIEPVFTR